MKWTKMELGSGRIHDLANKTYQLEIAPTYNGLYTNAQIDDYQGRHRKDYLWQANTHMSLESCFSHNVNQLKGTAGFGFWNAPFGDPQTKYPALPKSVWFFFGSEPSDLPLSPTQPGRGFFASTLDATTWQALLLSPFALPTIIFNNLYWFRRNIWSKIQKRLNISFCSLDNLDITTWHKYEIYWKKSDCTFLVDNKVVLQTKCNSNGPLGFVCWIDNQYMICTPAGNFGSGVINIEQEQWLKIRNLSVQKLV